MPNLILMAEKPQATPYFVLPEKRDLLDIMESYKYMNSHIISDLFAEGLWDHGAGWVHLNAPEWEWRVRFADEPKSPFPEASRY
ncbi:hypothetical protein [Leptospira sp. GIMC2001]|uniref:hypothetical protein n=1 Tax=Leptospira sp. GIMC2001 TaxID=1513297 RepID=UPI00234A642A|nr:hypothetical protein [Leptospira sp. GIMC2001]WCL50435.1 hypothetical protein O4O04_06340 [Leptospira sp. GIMC2001]